MGLSPEFDIRVYGMSQKATSIMGFQILPILNNTNFGSYSIMAVEGPDFFTSAYSDFIGFGHPVFISIPI